MTKKIPFPVVDVSFVALRATTARVDTHSGRGAAIQGAIAHAGAVF